VVDDDGQERVDALGTAEFWLLDFDQCRRDEISPREALDAECADTARFCDLVDDDGWSRDLIDFLGRIPGPDLVIADRTTINPEWRGHGLSLIMASVALREVGRGRGLAAMVPSPTELVAGDASNKEIDRESGRLRALWDRLGYVEFENDVHVLKLTKTSLERRAARFVAEYRARADVADSHA
jgi:GNAT superfamily N-acetyltransferase